ncbi:hypothetical protein ACN42_g9814 [Penicillium freii]|uniref:Uncharacterized protein n=1 Tax=Penicillium freii TaxID=48697 RepID=A0A101MB70_PENFR|nr:hypothetical protein ACN42_g9814 [Penicillium freii]
MNVLVQTKNPSNPLLKHANVLAAIATALVAAPATPGKSKKNKGKRRADGKDLTGGGGTVVASPSTSAGADKNKRKGAGGSSAAMTPRKKAKTGGAMVGGAKKNKYPDVPFTLSRSTTALTQVRYGQ